MTRKELTDKAFAMIREDLGNEVKEKDIWKALAETNDDEVYFFVCYPQERERLLRKVGR